MTKKFIAIALLASAALQVSAAERSETQIRQAAAAALAKMPSAMHKVRSAQPLRILAKNTQLTVVGYEMVALPLLLMTISLNPCLATLRHSLQQITTLASIGI